MFCKKQRISGQVVFPAGLRYGLRVQSKVVPRIVALCRYEICKGLFCCSEDFNEFSYSDFQAIPKLYLWMEPVLIYLSVTGTGSPSVLKCCILAPYVPLRTRRSESVPAAERAEVPCLLLLTEFQRRLIQSITMRSMRL